jgi:hypothetical protein
LNSSRREEARLEFDGREISIHPPEGNGNVPGGARSSAKRAENHLRKSLFFNFLRTGVTFHHRRT